MSDLLTRDTGIVLAIALAAVLIIFPLQLALCFKAKKRIFRLLPAALLALSAVTFYIMAITAKTWIAFAYIIIAVFAGVLLIFSGIAWGIWALIKLFRKMK